MKLAHSKGLLPFDKHPMDWDDWEWLLWRAFLELEEERKPVKVDNKVEHKYYEI